MRRLAMIAFLAGFLVVLLVVALAVILHQAEPSSVTTSRLSPDELTRAVLVERPGGGKTRGVSVQLVSLADGKTTTILTSPEEGGPAGSERLIWSKDGTKLLLVGRHFFVKEDLFLDNGDQLYFLYEVPNKRAYRNAPQTDFWTALTADQVEGVEFTEPVRLSPR